MHISVVQVFGWLSVCVVVVCWWKTRRQLSFKGTKGSWWRCCWQRDECGANCKVVSFCPVSAAGELLWHDGKKDAEHQVAFCRLEKCYNASPFTTEPWTCYGRHLREVSLISAVSPSVGPSLVHKAVSSQSHQSFLSVRLKFAVSVKCLWGCARVNSNCNCTVLFGLCYGHRVTLLVFIWNNSKNILEFYNVFLKKQLWHILVFRFTGTWIYRATVSFFGRRLDAHQTASPPEIKNAVRL